MQVVININDKIYKAILDGWWPNNLISVRQLIANGMPLPKGHGDLIDVNEVKKKHPLEIDGLDLRSNNQCLHTAMDKAQIIIKADKTESEGQAKLIDGDFDTAIKVLETLFHEDWEKYSDELYTRAYDADYDGGYDRGHDNGWEECYEHMQSMMETEQ